MDAKTTYQLIVSQLKDDGYFGLADMICKATLTPMSVEVPPNKLSEIVSNAAQKEDLLGMELGVPTVHSDIFDKSSKPGSKSYTSSGSSSGPIQLATPKIQSGLRKRHTGAVTALAFSADGSHCATGSMDRAIKILECKKALDEYESSSSSGMSIGHRGSQGPKRGVGVTSSVVTTLYLHYGPVTCMTFHPYLPILASADSEGLIAINAYLRDRSAPLLKFHDPDAITAMEWHGRGSILFYGGIDGRLRAYDVDKKECYIPAHHIGKGSGSKHLSTATGSSGLPTTIISELAAITCIACVSGSSVMKDIMAIGRRDGTIELMNSRTLVQICKISLVDLETSIVETAGSAGSAGSLPSMTRKRLPNQEISSLQFSNAKPHLLIGATSGNGYIYDLRNSSILPSSTSLMEFIRGEYIEKCQMPSSSSSFPPIRLHVHDSGGKPPSMSVLSLPGCMAPILQLRYICEDNFIVAVQAKSYLATFNATDGKKEGTSSPSGLTGEIKRHTSQIIRLESCRSKPYLLTGGNNGFLQFWSYK
ncbi:Cleavage stimulation factor subunit 1-like protein [Aduncisulcus paluster]|uniref:Cleavage stimulation factor 50 kDa subunit n=1 Tax=Aduncisulcus paluster TaxID=2918883 RepID=A0ABQ5KGP7_9EUKA|nr:Cleavage stimulation factor subunit 1-like protein [Aduncisulcus paluster]|eukprot:gnl/Carplike_NY0171/5050_a6894_290.p1 GENE.gnl/Carplike_NY0171/5050_a6894_290~~gnl/Carplike_NY0171/5050_a6894_290.p1  ORF type:complete len:534 (-),score=85.19 gnl/Carplike_NY0171/5050_a6894_290:20-1621(-)